MITPTTGENYDYPDVQRLLVGIKRVAMTIGIHPKWIWIPVVRFLCIREQLPDIQISWDSEFSVYTYLQTHPAINWEQELSPDEPLRNLIINSYSYVRETLTYGN